MIDVKPNINLGEDYAVFHRRSVFLCSLEKFAKSPLFPKIVFDCSLKNIPNCSPEFTLFPSSLEKFAHVSINENGKLPCSP